MEFHKINENWKLTSCDIYLDDTYLALKVQVYYLRQVLIGKNFIRKERQTWNRLIHAKSKRQKMKQIKRYLGYKLKYGGRRG
jgi:hypothetical protein